MVADTDKRVCTVDSTKKPNNWTKLGQFDVLENTSKEELLDKIQNVLRGKSLGFRLVFC